MHFIGYILFFSLVPFFTVSLSIWCFYIKIFSFSVYSLYVFYRPFSFIILLLSGFAASATAEFILYSPQSFSNAVARVMRCGFGVGFFRVKYSISKNL